MCIRWADGIACVVAGVLAALVGVAPARAQGYPDRFDFGQPVSEQDIAAVAIAVGIDGRGLPPGRGDYAHGKQVYETTCAACHGADLTGVANLPNMPSGTALRLIGGRGTLTRRNPLPTVESYWPYATTLFDYIRRAMPFQAPGSLSNEEVYAVSAYILGEAKIIDKSMALDAQSLPKVQMPNRNGFVPDPRPEVFK